MKQNIFKGVFAVLSGSMLTLSFAPFFIDILAIVSLVIFLHILNDSEKIYNAFFNSVLFGLGFFGTSIYWIYISIHLFTQSIGISFASVIILIIILSFLHIIPFGTFSYILTKKSSNLNKVLIYPSLWTLFEITKANLLWGGFPWVSLGYSQTESCLIWFATIGGVYLVSYIVAFIACLIVFYICNKSNIKKITYCIVIICTIYLCGFIIKYNQPPVQTNQSQKVSLVQGNFIQGFKWDYNNYVEIEKYYENITNENKNSLIILSESAIPSYIHYSKNYFNKLNEIANKNNNALLIGYLNIEKYENFSKIYNSSILIGQGYGIYNKHHLVPFGEYIPINFFGYVDNVGFTNFNAGNKIQKLMNAFGNPIANFICYEVVYPNQVRNQLQGAKIISVISDDSWFGNSIVRDQKLQISQVRAIENAKFVLTTTSNGITSIINSHGKIETKLPKNIRGTLKETVYLNSYTTIWTKIGMSFIFLLIIINLIIAIILKILIENNY